MKINRTFTVSVEGIEIKAAISIDTDDLATMADEFRMEDIGQNIFQTVARILNSYFDPLKIRVESILSDDPAEAPWFDTCRRCGLKTSAKKLAKK